MENLSYAIVQVMHNFGAIAVAGGPLFAWYPVPQPNTIRRKIAWIVALGWSIQVISGMGFATVSYFFYGKLPDLHGIAIAALFLKIFCGISGLMLVVGYLRRSTTLSLENRDLTWKILAGFGWLALASAAFLRWFS